MTSFVRSVKKHTQPDIFVHKLGLYNVLSVENIKKAISWGVVGI